MFRIKKREQPARFYSVIKNGVLELRTDTIKKPKDGENPMPFGFNALLSNVLRECPQGTVSINLNQVSVFNPELPKER
jgi:hypothetical protein